MEQERPAPQRHGDLHDPKLPVINGGHTAPRVNPAPIPPQPEL